ncbi:MAG: metal-sulfur cluster assembly factor [Flavobacteriales bacterium]|nr:metal-sulfur cluster assembly factor [Flavobacteriales bacterium]
MTRELNEKENEVFLLLKGVIDPELMVNIIDLGLVYDVSIGEIDKSIIITMTLTSPGCPMGDAIKEDVQQLILKNYEGYSVNINLVWEPPWTLANITEAGNIALNGH